MGRAVANRTLSRGESDSVVKIAVILPGTPANPGTLPIQLLAGGAQDPNLLDNRYTDAFELGVRAQGGGVWSFDLTAFAHRMRDDVGARMIAGVPAFVALPQPHLEANTVGAPTVHLRGVEGFRGVAPGERLAPPVRRQLPRSARARRRLGHRPGPPDVRHPRWLAHWRNVIDLAADWRLDARVRHAGERNAPTCRASTWRPTPRWTPR